ncbi:MAG: TatD family hydrolase [Vagococcus sp.]
MKHPNLIDAHCHLDLNGELFTYLTEAHIPSIINCQNPEEWKRNVDLTRDYPHLYLSAGIHPWDIDNITLADFSPYLNETAFIGEIGMDSVWTSTSLIKQEDICRAQLSFASLHHKPVILHTKGQEKKVCELIKSYPNNYLVHWYSTTDFLSAFIDLDCFFTIGPSIKTDVTVQHIVNQVPNNRLLLESDGIEALKWATGSNNYLNEQQQSLKFLAYLLNLSIEETSHLLTQNFNEWIELSKKAKQE